MCVCVHEQLCILQSQFGPSITTKTPGGTYLFRDGSGFSKYRCFSLHQDLLRPFGAELGPTDHAEKSQVSSRDYLKVG